MNASLARFDGAAAFEALTPTHQAEIGAIALEIAAAWEGIVGASPPPAVSRAAQEALHRLSDRLYARARDMLTAGTFTEGDVPRVPSLIGPVCHACGCSEHDACWTEAGPCAWAEPDLCTGCAGAAR